MRVLGKDGVHWRLVYHWMRAMQGMGRWSVSNVAQMHQKFVG